MSSDRFYDIIAGQAKEDPDFRNILDMTEGSLQYQGDDEEDGNATGGVPIGSLTLLDSGHLILRVSNQHDPQAFLQALEHAHNVITGQMNSEDDED